VVETLKDMIMALAQQVQAVRGQADAHVNGGQEPLLFGDEMAVLGQAVEVLLMRRCW